MSNISNFEKVLLVIFGFIAAFGLLAFSTYKSSESVNNNIEVVVWGSLDKEKFDKFIIDVADNENIKLNVKYIQKDSDSIDGDLLDAVASGNAPDTVIVSQNFINKYYDKIYPIDYKTYPQRTFLDTYIQEAELLLRPDGISGIPFYSDPLVMYWNKDIFNSAGIAAPPTKWSEFSLMSPLISKSDINANLTKSFVSFGEYQNVDNIKEILSMLILQSGNKIVDYNNGQLHSYFSDETSSTTINRVSSALSFFTEYSNPKKTVYSWNRSLPYSKQVFLSDDLAIYFGKASEYNDIKNKNPNLNFDITVVPQIVDTKNKVTFGDIYYFMFLKNSKNLLNTYNTLSYLTNVSSSKIFLNYFNLSPVRKDIISEGSDNPIRDIFYKSSLISRGWIDPNYQKTGQIFKEMIEEITTGKSNVQSSLQKAGIEIKNLIE